MRKRTIVSRQVRVRAPIATVRPMVPLRDLVRDRLRTLGIRQGELADRLHIDPANLSKILGGSASVPLERAQDWTKALDLHGGEAESLIDALHLAAATERVRAMVNRFEAEAVRGRRLDELFRDRVGVLRYILDHLAAAPVDPPGVIPPTAIETRRLLNLIADLVHAALRAEAPARRVAEPGGDYRADRDGAGGDPDG